MNPPISISVGPGLLRPHGENDEQYNESTQLDDHINTAEQLHTMSIACKNHDSHAVKHEAFVLSRLGLRSNSRPQDLQHLGCTGHVLLNNVEIERWYFVSHSFGGRHLHHCMHPEC